MIIVFTVVNLISNNNNSHMNCKIMISQLIIKVLITVIIVIVKILKIVVIIVIIVIVKILKIIVIMTVNLSIY